MTSPKNLFPRTLVFLALMVVSGSVGNIFLSEGMKRLGRLDGWRVSELAGFFFRALSSHMIWLGIGTLLLFFVSYLLILSWADYSYVLPASAAGYALVVWLGSACLGEQVTALRWIGVGLICLGVAIVGRTPLNTRERK